MTLSEQIIAARKASKLSQVEFAVFLGASLATVQRWESGTHVPTQYLHVVALERFGIPITAMRAALGQDVAA